jgi:hypothetical protein
MVADTKEEANSRHNTMVGNTSMTQEKETLRGRDGCLEGWLTEISKLVFRHNNERVMGIEQKGAMAWP